MYIKELDKQINCYLYELEEMLVPGILQKFTQLVGQKGNQSDEVMKIKHLWAAKLTLEWAKKQQEQSKLSDELHKICIN
jgi:hypothetical protein